MRTLLQHQWAELSEKLSDVVGASIKYGEGDQAALSLLAQVTKFIVVIESIEKLLADLFVSLQQQGLSLDEGDVARESELRNAKGEILEFLQKTSENFRRIKEG